MIGHCIDCGTERVGRPSYFDRYPRCMGCAGLLRRGVKLTPQHRAQLRDAKLGTKHSAITRMRISLGNRRAIAEGRRKSVLKNLTDAEGREYRKLRYGYGTSRADTLRAIGRSDLI